MLQNGFEACFSLQAPQDLRLRLSSCTMHTSHVTALYSGQLPVTGGQVHLLST